MALGLQIRSYNNQPGVFVHHLVPGSRADHCGLLHPGDRVLEANGQDLKFVSVDDAASIISVSPKGVSRRLPQSGGCLPEHLKDSVPSFTAASQLKKG